MYLINIILIKINNPDNFNSIIIIFKTQTFWKIILKKKGGGQKYEHEKTSEYFFLGEVQFGGISINGPPVWRVSCRTNVENFELPVGFRL